MASNGKLTGKQRLGWTVLTIVVLLYALFPVAAIFATSFKTPADLGNAAFLPSNWTWQNYEMILLGDAQGLFLTALRNSIGITLIATFIAVVKTPGIASGTIARRKACHWVAPSTWAACSRSQGICRKKAASVQIEIGSVRDRYGMIRPIQVS